MSPWDTSTDVNLPFAFTDHYNLSSYNHILITSPNAIPLSEVITEQKTNDETDYQYLGPVTAQGMIYRKSHNGILVRGFAIIKLIPKSISINVMLQDPYLPSVPIFPSPSSTAPLWTLKHEQLNLGVILKGMFLSLAALLIICSIRETLMETLDFKCINNTWVTGHCSHDSYDSICLPYPQLHCPS